MRALPTAEVLLREVLYTSYYDPKGLDAFLHLQPALQLFKSETLTKVLMELLEETVVEGTGMTSRAPVLGCFGLCCRAL